MNNRRLFISNLSWDTNEETIKTIFSKISKVEKVEIIKNRFSGKSEGIAFVTISNEDDIRDVIELLNGKTVDGKKIMVTKPNPEENRFNRAMLAYA